MLKYNRGHALRDRRTAVASSNRLRRIYDNQALFFDSLRASSRAELAGKAQLFSLRHPVPLANPLHVALLRELISSQVINTPLTSPQSVFNPALGRVGMVGWANISINP